MVCVWIDGSGAVLRVCLEEKQGRDKSVVLGSEGSRSESENWAFAVPKYLTAYCNFLSKGFEIFLGAAGYLNEGSVNLIDSPEDRNSLSLSLFEVHSRCSIGGVVAILPWYLSSRKRRSQWWWVQLGRCP